LEEYLKNKIKNNNMNKKGNNLPKKGKTLKAFLNEEDGKIAKKNIAKFGLTVLSGAMVLISGMKPHDVSATCTHSNHGSHSNHSNHGNHASHCSHSSGDPYNQPCNTHGSHSSHCSGGWCP
jgi:hypothetical protein